MSATSWRDHLPVAWVSRGLGLDFDVVCFVCGAERRCEGANPAMNNIAAHLHPNDETAALACFPQGARMGYYHADPASPQIKVGACDRHVPVLEVLGAQWFISRHRVEQLVRDTLWLEERQEKSAAQ